MNPASTENGQRVRDTGLEAVGDVPWGSHFCVFYETKKDLLDVLVPYFNTGLRNNEFCLWIVASYEFLNVNEATKALRKSIPRVDRLIDKGNIEIVEHRDWFLRDGKVDISKAVGRFRQRMKFALTSGFEGLRANGSPAWLQVYLRAGGFRKFEQQIEDLLAKRRMIAACTFPLKRSGAEQILDAARTHQFAITVRHGVWKRVEIANIAAARKEARNIDPKLDQLTLRQREILQRIAEGQNTKESAALLGISVKTVEAHRLQLMRRLKIDNVPGLVRFAIRTGLVSPEE
jgi:DNA-binding CsgD family transcriptional regulator